MKFFTKCKDGGDESTVTAYILIEIKWLFSIMLLRFDGLSRDAMHDHAFHAISWLLRGELREFVRELLVVDAQPGWDLRAYYTKVYRPRWLPILTLRSRLHCVDSVGRSWALTFRGPWLKEWHESLPGGVERTLTNGRVVVAESQRVAE